MVLLFELLLGEVVGVLHHLLNLLLLHLLVNLLLLGGLHLGYLSELILKYCISGSIAVHLVLGPLRLLGNNCGIRLLRCGVLLLGCDDGLLINLIVSIRRNFLGHFSLDLGGGTSLDLLQLCLQNLQGLVDDQVLALDLLDCLVVLHDLFAVLDHLLFERANIGRDLLKCRLVLQ